MGEITTFAADSKAAKAIVDAHNSTLVTDTPEQESYIKPSGILEQKWHKSGDWGIVNEGGVGIATAAMQFDGSYPYTDALAALPDLTRAVVVMRDGCVESTAMYRVAIGALKKAGVM
jgi:hypothetical protein